MSRYRHLTEYNETDTKKLKNIIQNPLSDPDLAIRAKAILSFLDGMTGESIARELNVRPNTVSDWRKRYEAEGVEGLYDKAPKGKRGSATRDRVLEMLDNQAPEGGWSTRTLAEAVGTSQDTVRRALRDEHLSVSRSCIWDREIRRAPAMVCVNAVGLYMSNKEAGLIIRVESQMRTQTSSTITTCNRNLARHLEQMEQSERGLSLKDAIRGSVQEMKERYQENREVFQDFLGKLLKENAEYTNDLCGNESGFYYIFYWHESSMEMKSVLQKTGVIVETAEDAEDWIRMIKPWVDILCQDIEHEDEGKDSLISLIDVFMKKTTAFVEPFEWRRVPV